MESAPSSRRSPKSETEKRIERRQLILEAGSLDRVLDYSNGEGILQDEANDPDPSMRLLWKEHFDYLRKLREERCSALKKPYLAYSSDDVVIVPGFFASSLRDVGGSNGLIWIDPKLFPRKVKPYRGGKELSALEIGPFDEQRPLSEQEADENVKIAACGHIPATVEMLSMYLEFWRYSPRVFAFDWRKNLECAASQLAGEIRSRISHAFRPLHIIAHSLGAVVARRALQLLGSDIARRLVSNLVLLGPISQGSFSPACVLAGDIGQIDLLRLYGIKPPPDFGRVLQSFTALYQLLPWSLSPKSANRPSTFLGLKGIDERRLTYGNTWARSIDSRFFNDRTTILLGDKPTPCEFAVNKGSLLSSGKTAQGDGVVTDQQARLDGVRAYRMPRGEHSRLLLYPQIHSAIRAILKNETPDLAPPREFMKARAFLSLREEWRRPVAELRMRSAAGAGTPQGAQDSSITAEG